MSQIQVILIGGPPGAGKSTLGRAVAAELGYASLTVDDLLVSARVLTTKESHPAFHQMSGVGHVSHFTDGPKEKLVSDSLAQEEANVVDTKTDHLVSHQEPVSCGLRLVAPTSESCGSRLRYDIAIRFPAKMNAERSYEAQLQSQAT